jgi:hypothetical protein
VNRSRNKKCTIEKRHDKKGNLKWAKAFARDLYRDREINNLCPVHWRVAGQASRWFTSLLPRHVASSWLGDPPARPISKTRRPPSEFKQWGFVLAKVIESDGMLACLGQEISGDTAVEVAFP